MNKEIKRQRNLLKGLSNETKKKKRFFFFLKKKSFYIPAIVFFVILVAGGVVGAKTYPIVQAILSDVNNAKNNLTEGQNLLVGQNFSEGREKIQSAEMDLNSAQDKFSTISWIRYIPIARTQYTAADNVFKSLDHLTNGIFGLIDVAESVLTPLQESTSSSIATISSEERIQILQALTEAESALENVQEEFDTAIDYINKIPNNGLLRVVKEGIEPLKESAPKLQNTISQIVPLAKSLPSFVGYPSQKNYLLLFQNNTELRPTGGFIGTYGIIKMRDGDILSLTSDNVYNLDEAAKKNGLNITPPEPLYQYNAVQQWFLRDSNWSPDFPTSAQKALEMYSLENGQEKNLGGVIAIDPTFIQSLLKITGAITISGVTFNEENFVQKLQEHVSQGYKTQGLETSERKDIIGDLGSVLMDEIFKLPKVRWQELFITIEKNLAEKHALLWMNDPNFQSVLASQNWDGHIIQDTSRNDFGIVDANLASLKTDPAVTRTTNYQLTELENGNIQVHVIRTYENTGKLNWKTTRYRTYARMYVPLGSSIVSSSGAMIDCKKEGGQVTTANDLSHTVYSLFLCIEPGETKSFEITYILPESLSVVRSDPSTFNIFFTKQPGTPGDTLSIEVEFKKRITAIEPTIDTTQQISDTHVLLQDTLNRDKTYRFSL